MKGQGGIYKSCEFLEIYEPIPTANYLETVFIEQGINIKTMPNTFPILYALPNLVISHIFMQSELKKYNLIKY